MRKLCTILSLICLLAFPAFSDTGKGDMVMVAPPSEPQVRFNCYPNPTPRNLSIDLTFERNAPYEVEIHMRNLIGKEMMEAVKVQNTGSAHHMDLDLADLPSGIYLMEVTTHQNGNTFKVIRRITKA